MSLLEGALATPRMAGLRWWAAVARKHLFRARGVIVLVALLGAWETASRAGLANVRLFPPFSEVLARFWTLWLDTTFPGHLAATLQRMLLGYLLAGLVGICLGLLMGYWKGVYERLELLLEVLRPLPPVALIPPFILLLGIGDEMKVALVFVGAIWPILLNTADGVRGVHPTLVDAARMYHFGHARVLRQVLFPAALPQVMAGLRVSLAISLILALVSEMVAARQGLGYFILNAQRSFRITDMYAGIVLLAMLGYTLNRVFLLFERRVMAWHLVRSEQAE